jgi:hypothetical protein
MGFASFMASAVGRIVRVVAGLALIGGGIALMVSSQKVTLGIVLAVVGLVPFFAGIFDFCVFAPLFGAPFTGKAVRARRLTTVG